MNTLVVSVIDRDTYLGLEESSSVVEMNGHAALSNGDKSSGPDSRSPAHPAEQDPLATVVKSDIHDVNGGAAEFRRRPKRPPPRFTEHDATEDDSGDEFEGVRIRGRPAPKIAALSRSDGLAHWSKEESFDQAAPLPQPSRPSAAGVSSQRRKLAFAAADGTPVSIAASTPSSASTSTPAFRAAGGSTPSSASRSVHWKKSDERAAKRENRSPSPDARTIAARNAAEAETTDFEERYRAEVAADGLDMERDWYLREEEGGVDEAGGMYQAEETYNRGGQKKEVSILRFAVTAKIYF